MHVVLQLVVQQKAPTSVIICTSGDVASCSQKADHVVAVFMLCSTALVVTNKSFHAQG